MRAQSLPDKSTTALDLFFVLFTRRMLSSLPCPSIRSTLTLGLVRLAGDPMGFNAALPDNYGQEPEILALHIEQLRVRLERSKVD